MPRKLTVYLAGPDVFLPEAIAIGERKKQLCKKYGFDGLFPFDNEIAPGISNERVDTLIFRANVAMIRRADFGIFNLTPFRGPSADVGTVFELGMLVGLEKPAFGYTNVAESLFERVAAGTAISRDPAYAVWRDSDGMTIEDFGNADNLMIDAALAGQGHPIIRCSTPAADRFRNLSGFETCLQLAAKALLRNAHRGQLQESLKGM
jgi:nucleoside 2-deoxyribosyltransferase